MEFNELRVLKSVFEEGGFAKASNKLFMTQSAVSQSVANLENKLGTKLLVRSVPPKLTIAGEKVLNYSRSILYEKELLVEELEELKKGRFSVLSIAVNNFVNINFMPELLASFFKEMPLTKLKVEIQPSREIIYSVESEKFEIGFGPFQKRMSAFEKVPFFKESSVLVVHKNHSEISKLTKNPKKFLNEIPLITSYLDQPELRPSKEKLRDSFKIVWETNSAKLRLNLVAKGLGATFVEEKILQEDPICRDFLKISNLPFGKIEKEVGIYFKKNSTLSEAGQKFVKICKEFWK
ncbi:MAG: LysR family transcriptional regulator [Calditrichaeota bacterium]|nr:MAG: LysR family transcriptional regulator [Calditrichota bacterium]